LTINAGSDAAQGTVIFYNNALAFNPAKSRLALEEKNVKVSQSSFVFTYLMEHC
jgi:hypothetical protein